MGQRDGVAAVVDSVEGGEGDGLCGSTASGVDGDAGEGAAETTGDADGLEAEADAASGLGLVRGGDATGVGLAGVLPHAASTTPRRMDAA
jgi:hypothetical protein